MKKANVVSDSVKLLSETDAADLMWSYYSANKGSLVSQVREYRDLILEQLMSGRPVEDVFSNFVTGSNLPASAASIQAKKNAKPVVTIKRAPWLFAPY